MSTNVPNPALCFMVVVWGERYRRYLTDYCLPSLLAPHNIPCIENKQDSKFIITTTAEDWAELNKLEVFERLRAHIEPVFLELPPFTDADPKMLTMSSGHKKLSNYAFKSRCFGININPDTIFSDCMVRDLQDCARRGVKMVVYPGFRFEMEGIIADLQASGYLSDPHTITIPPRVAAGVAIRNQHPFTIACNWDDDCFFEFPVWHFVMDPGRTMMLLHTISMGPLMLDYAAIDSHSDEIFDKWTLDGDYAHSNFGHFNLDTEIDYVDDSDRFKILSLTPRSEEVPPRVPVRGGRFMREFNKGMHLWRVYTDPVTDPLKKRLYLRRVVIHEGDLGETFERLVARDRRILERYVLAAVTDESVLAYDALHHASDGRIRAPRGPSLGARVALRVNQLLGHGTIGRLAAVRTRRLAAVRTRRLASNVQSALHRTVARAIHRTAYLSHRLNYLSMRLDFYRRHYSAQGPAHVRYYYYRGRFHILHHAAQFRSRAVGRARGTLGRARCYGPIILKALMFDATAIARISRRSRAILRSLVGKRDA